MPDATTFAAAVSQNVAPATSPGDAGGAPAGATRGLPHPDAPEIALRVLSRRAETHFRVRFPADEYPVLDYSADTWEFKRANRAKGGKAAKVIFSLITRDGPALPGDLVAGLKAFLALSGMTPGSAMNHYALAARHWWQFLRARGINAESFSWDRLSVDDVAGFEAHLAAGEKSRNTIAQLTRSLDTLLAAMGRSDLEVAKTMTYHTPGRQAGDESAEGQSWQRDAKLPTRAAVEGVARIYREAKTADNRADWFLAAVWGLLLLTGFRESELRSLPGLALRDEYDPKKKRQRVGLRFWNQKTRGGPMRTATRWLSPLGAEMAKELLADLAQLAADARAYARRLEEQGGRVALPLRATTAMLTRREAAGWLGHANEATLKETVRRCTPDSPFAGLKTQPWDGSEAEGMERRPRVGYRRADVEAVLSRLQGGVVVCETTVGSTQSLAETLLIHFDDEFSSYTTRHLVVRALSYGTLSRFAHGENSAFRRYGIKDPDLAMEGLEACFARMSSHQPRHWINTVAHKAGLSAFLITVWMQRANPEHTLAYLHDSADIANIVVGKIEDGTLQSDFANAVRALPPEARARTLEAVDSAHVLEGVTYCTESDAPERCARHRACPACGAWHHDPSDPHTHASLVVRRNQLREALVALDEHAAAGLEVVARQREVIEEQIRYLDETLEEDHCAA